ncbi:ROK family glucokinase [Herbidospora galbida]|uniref:Glucokinase n=1 Tax=Herbidospora galbida TaxID=2575442 RepID=A0A4U3LNR1_9ACTN|nr:ROK family glucokinase [Herbidospora galbida]TKK77262.1 ROK family glucokinase [Herbidospora galbida]
MALTIGIDIGGTKVAAGVVDAHGLIVESLLKPTPADNPAKVAETVAEAIKELADSYEVEAVGVGAAGFIDETRSVVRFAPNLAWREEPLQRKLTEMTGLPIVVENDANAMAWGEFRFGAGRGESHLIAVTVGTGIGGGLILGGAVYRGRWGMGGELGHMQTVPGGVKCGCGNLGCWEQYASGNALVRDAQRMAAADPERAATMLKLAGGTPESIEGREITDAGRAGDPVALDAFANMADWIGQGLADLASILDPGCFILGGGVSNAADLWLDRAREAFAERLTGRGHRPVADVRLAELGASAGVVGAADLARLP